MSWYFIVIAGIDIVIIAIALTMIVFIIAKGGLK